MHVKTKISRVTHHQTDWQGKKGLRIDTQDDLHIYATQGSPLSHAKEGDNLTIQIHRNTDN